MPPSRKTTPSYVEHKQSGRARAVWYDRAGVRQQRLLPGEYGSSQSRTAFGKLLLELEVQPLGAAIGAGQSLTLVEMLAAYITHAERHYRGPDGKPTSELAECKLVVRALRELYGDEPAAEFGALKLKAVRQGWVVAGLSRGEANRRAGIVKRIFKWAASEELIAAAVYHGLTVVTGLQKGRTVARETEPVGPVDDSTVDATLEHLNRHVRGLIEFQRLTGCRPGEACNLRRCDIDTGGSVWLYKPATHKTAHKGKSRIIAIGPRAQDVLREFFTLNLDDYLFSPARAVAELNAERAANRKTKLYPSHERHNKARRKAIPKRAPAAKYTHTSYSQAVARACEDVFPPPAPLARLADETAAAWKARLTPGQRQELSRWRKQHRWAPNQLRHSYATKVRKTHGLEAAQVLLGHSRADVTQVYAERNESLAVTIAAKMG